MALPLMGLKIAASMFAGMKRASKVRSLARSVRPQFDVKTVFNGQRLIDAADRAAINGLYKSAYAVSQEAKGSIATSKSPAPAGRPPHTRGRRGKSLRAAIRYAVDRQAQDAVIGPTAKMLGDVGGILERGGSRGKTKHKARPFMGPALDRTLPRIMQQFEDLLQ